MERIKEIAEILNKEEYHYQRFGFRGLTEHDMELIKEGKTELDKSTDDWDNREIAEYADDTEKLSGTSAISIDQWEDWKYEDEDKALGILEAQYKKALGYSTEYHKVGEVALIAGDFEEYGYDEDEIVISGAEILAII